MDYRWYQEECSEALFKSVSECIESGNPSKVHPVAIAPTGSGKTFIICLFLNKFLTKYPRANVLVLSDTSEILEQDKAAIDNYFELDCGLFSSGLNSKIIRKITVAGIQSAYRVPERFSHFDVCIVDESHMVNVEDEGMYRTFLKHIDANYVGLTATAFRTGQGKIYNGGKALFNHLAYDLSSFENYNRLVDEGYLSKMYSKKTDSKLNVEGVKTIAGDFSKKDLSEKNNRADITKKIIKECLKFKNKYKKWLIFAIDIKHAMAIESELIENGMTAKALYSGMKENRKDLINDFKNGKFQVAVNVNILTKGFDAPDIDLIILARPTKSPILHVQMLGRGGRVHPDKDHCLVLDFAGNVGRLGPINDVIIPTGKKGSGSGNAPVRECPNCGIQNHISLKFCESCNFEFVNIEKIKPVAGELEIIKKSREEINWYSVLSISYSLHEKRGSPPCLKVTYGCLLFTFHQYVLIDHRNFARSMAKKWIKNRWPTIYGDPPDTLTELWAFKDKLAKPKKIMVDTGKKYNEILDFEF